MAAVSLLSLGSLWFWWMLRRADRRHSLKQERRHREAAALERKLQELTPLPVASLPALEQWIEERYPKELPLTT